MPDGLLVLCPSTPEGVDFLTSNNAWGYIRLSRTPKYLALYISQPVSEIRYVGEVQQVFDAYAPDSPVKPEVDVQGKKLLSMKDGGLDSHSQKVESLRKDGVPKWLGTVPASADTKSTP